MKRLYLTLYLALLGILIASVASAALLLHFDGGFRRERQAMAHALARAIVERLPPPESPDYEAALSREAKSLSVELYTFDSARRPLSSTAGHPLPFPEAGAHGGFLHDGAPGILVEVPEGYLAATFPHRRGASRFFLGLASFALVAALCCYPLARGITWRLEELERSMRRWGRGELSLRAEVRGRDEVAGVARGFNDAADRVTALLEQRARILASASHELRSPLSRLTMALELMPEVDDSRRRELRAQAEKDVEELDALIEDLLLAARAEAGASSPREVVELGSLLSREAGRAGVPLLGGAARVRGDARMLKRLVRNLLDNARRHADPESVELELETTRAWARILVLDRGPGVPPSQRERIFEPFYRPQGHAEGDDGGVGLGLSLVRQIAQAHAGRARCEARPGGGSRFVVELPLAEAPRAAGPDARAERS